MPTVKLIDPGFTTADAGYPSMNFDNGNLQLRFVDWRERPVLVFFMMSVDSNGQKNRMTTLKVNRMMAHA